MTALPHAISADHLLAFYERRRAALPPSPARDTAAAWLRAHGLPGARDEAWKYTSLRALADFAPSDVSAPAATLPALGELEGAPRLVFVNGVFAPHLSTAPRPPAPAAPPPPTDALLALNTLLSEDGAHISIEAARDAGLLLLIHLGEPGAAASPRHVLHIAAGARLTLFEIAAGAGAYLHNAVTHVTLGPGAHLTHARLQTESPEALHFATVTAEIAEGAAYDGFTLSLGAALARATIRAHLVGPGAHAALNAAQRLGARQHGDITTVVRHAAPDGTSRQTVKNVLDGHARAVFQGRIEVAQAAQRTDGYQMNQVLLLADTAEIDSKPELEIFADDVKCSHGATVGALDAEQLFYLLSRGIPRAEARAILVRAFLEDALGAVADERLRAHLTTLIDA